VLFGIGPHMYAFYDYPALMHRINRDLLAFHLKTIDALLAEQYHFLLAAITGYLGCELTLDGLAINGPDTERIRSLVPNFGRLRTST
jgi:hypothetical protein